MKNWKTTLTGFLGGLAVMFGPHLAGQPGPALTTGNLITGAALIVLGLFAKDNNVTGGTVPQTNEAISRTPPQSGN